MADRRKHLNTLGLATSASDGDIKKAYKQLALKYHPDKNDSHDAKARFQEISYAYKYLTDGPEAVSAVDPREDIMTHFFEQMFAEMFFAPFGQHGFHSFMFTHHHHRPQPHFYVYDSDEECYYDEEDEDDDYYIPPKSQGRDTKQDEHKPSNTQPTGNPDTKSSRKREKRLRQKARRKEFQEEQRVRELKQRHEEILFQERQKQEREQKQRQEAREARQQKTKTVNSMYTDDIQDGSPPSTGATKQTEGNMEADRPATSDSVPKKAAPQPPPKLTKEQQREKLIAEQKRREEEMQTIREELLKQQEQEREKKREKERKRAEKEKQAEKEKAEQEAEEMLNWFDNGKMSKKARKREKKLQEAAAAAKAAEAKKEAVEVEEDSCPANKPCEIPLQTYSVQEQPKKNHSNMDFPEVKPLPEKGKPRPTNQNNSKNKSKFKGQGQLNYGGQGQFEQGYSNAGLLGEYDNCYVGHSGNGFHDYYRGNHAGRGGRGGFHSNPGGFNHHPNGFAPHIGPFPPPPPPPQFGMMYPPQQFGGKHRGYDPARNGYQSYPTPPPLFNAPPPNFNNGWIPGFPPGHNAYSHNQQQYPQNGHNHQQHQQNNQYRHPQNNHNQHSQKQTAPTENRNQPKLVPKQQSKPYSSGKTFYNTTNDVQNGFQSHDSGNAKNSSQFAHGHRGDEKPSERRNFYDEFSAHASPDGRSSIDALEDMVSRNAHIDPPYSRPFVNKNHTRLDANYKGSNSSLDSLDEFTLPRKDIIGAGMTNKTKVVQDDRIGSSVSGQGGKTFVNKLYQHVGNAPRGSNGALDSFKDFAVPKRGSNASLDSFEDFAAPKRGSNASLDSFDDFAMTRNVGNAYKSNNGVTVNVNDSKISVPGNMGDGRSSVPEYNVKTHVNNSRYDDNQAEDDDSESEDDDSRAGNFDDASICSLDSLSDHCGSSPECSNKTGNTTVKDAGSSQRFTDYYLGYDRVLTTEQLNVPKGMLSAGIANYYK